MLTQPLIGQMTSILVVLRLPSYRADLTQPGLVRDGAEINFFMLMMLMLGLHVPYNICSIYSMHPKRIIGINLWKKYLIEHVRV